VRGNQDGIEQLLDLGIMGLRLIEYLADEVYWLLDFVHMADLLALDDDGSADYPIGCGYVEQQSLAFPGHRQGQRRCEKLLELYKSSVSFLQPLELLLCLEEFEEWQPFSSSRDMNRLRAAMHLVGFWMSLMHLGGFIFMTASTFSGLGCMPS
jgi:hypothetical protein